MPTIEPELFMPNLPPGFFPLEEICAHCHDFGFEYRPPEEGKGWAYCYWFKKWFQYQFEPTHTPAGSRTCGNWRQKGTVNAYR